MRSTLMLRILNAGLPELDHLATFKSWCLAGEYLLQKRANTASWRRAARQINIDWHHGVNRQHLVEQLRHDAVFERKLAVEIDIIDIDALEDRFGRPQWVAQRRHIAGHR